MEVPANFVGKLMVKSGEVYRTEPSDDTYY